MVSQEVRIVSADYALICGDDNSRRRIINMRQFVEGNPAGPFACVRRSLVRDAAIAAPANWNFSRSVITNMSVNVGIHKVLRGTAVGAQRGSKVFPVARPIYLEECAGFIQACIQRRPTQRVPFGILLEDDWAMTRYTHVEGLGVRGGVAKALADLDLFVPNLNIAPTTWRQVTSRVVLVKLFDVDVLNVGPEVRHSPGDAIVVA